jgi:predicted anti-sigma-YlaC factor YlaD
VNCAREAELLETVIAGRWPDGCEDELRAHLASCDVCNAFAELALLFHEEMQAATREAQLPHSGLVWWRAQRRARANAAKVVSRTFTLVQVAAVAGAIAFALTVIGGVSVMNESWQTWGPRLAEAIHYAGVYSRWILPVSIAAATFVLLTPVALYFALAED